MALMKKLIVWASLVAAAGVVLTMTSCAGLKVSLETELDANTNSLLNFLQ
tara:strand:- start:342 stop:491 length:150 start_codon:yes stop_codon:yes gene_type:complete